MPNKRGTVWADVVDGKNVMYVTGDAPHLHRRLLDFLKREARRDLDEASHRMRQR